MSGRERGNISTASPGSFRKNSRELAVPKSMDGGKTIKESRDIDLPLVAAHFFYYAGWADYWNMHFPVARAPLGVAAR